jgi:Eco29kI restriction endonuclease
MIDLTPYNPLDRENLGGSVAEAMLERSAWSLSSVIEKPFKGAGIYALYYTGKFETYELMAERNREKRFEFPIYIGKAVPAGARKGTVLWGRLKEHAETINAASTTLKLSDFHCRLLIVDDIWIPLAESLLISKFSPIWNKYLDGFGNHDPGKGRYNGLRPLWDVLHPGRGWADKCQARTETALQVGASVSSYLKTAAVPAKPKLLG